MRFPRQAKIFRGQLDAAPVAGVVFLLLMFLQLGSLLYTPGVLVHLNNPAATIQVGKDGRIRFGTNLYSVTDTSLLRAALQNSPAGPPFDLRVDPSAPPDVAARAREFVNSIFQLTLPSGPAGLIGTDNPTITVKVDFLGQYFYDNRILRGGELKEELIRQKQAAARESKELTLTVAADERVNLSAVTRLAQLAREAGIKDTVMAEWPSTPPPQQPP